MLVPVATVLAEPALLMVATAVFEELQVTELVRFWVLLSLYVPVAVNCCGKPLATEGFAGVTAIEVKVAAVGESITKLSKFVFQPLVLASVTGEQGPLHPVLIVATVPAATADCLLVCPEQLIVTVVLPEPPLYACRLTKRYDERNVKLPLV